MCVNMNRGASAYIFDICKNLEGGCLVGMNVEEEEEGVGPGISFGVLLILPCPAVSRQ